MATFWRSGLSDLSRRDAARLDPYLSLFLCCAVALAALYLQIAGGAVIRALSTTNRGDARIVADPAERHAGVLHGGSPCHPVRPVRSGGAARNVFIQCRRLIASAVSIALCLGCIGSCDRLSRAA